MTRVQKRTLLEIKSGTYRPLTTDWATRKALIARGLIKEHDGMYPRTYYLTDAGKQMLA